MGGGCAPRYLAVFSVRTRSQLAYAAASFRLSQNLAAVDAMTPGELKRFHDCLRRYKAIGQRDPASARSLRGVKRKAAWLAEQVYRSGSAGLANWAAVLGTAGQLAIGDDDSRRQSRSAGGRMLVEYMASVIPDGQVLSLPTGIERAS